MKRAILADVVAALLGALERIGEDDSWCHAPNTVGRAIVLPVLEAVARPAIIVKEPRWEDFNIETAGSRELGVASLTVEIYLCAGSDGFTGDIADELLGMQEDVVRAVREDASLAADNPDAPTLAQYLRPDSFEPDEEFSADAGYAIGKLTLTGRLDFQGPA